jgi:hypothetical protein
VTPSKPQFYTFAADLYFNKVGENKHRYDAVREFTLLPSEKNPVTMYLGQTADNRSLFLVDQRYQVKDNEGVCRPSGRQCYFLYLRPDPDSNEATLRHDPLVCPRCPDYHLELIDVRRVTDTREPSATSTASRSKRSIGGKQSGRRSKRTRGQRYFDFRIPVIAGHRR